MDDGTRSSSGATPLVAPVLSQSERGLVWPADDPPASVAALLQRSCQLSQSQFLFKHGTTRIHNLRTRPRRSFPHVPLNLFSLYVAKLNFGKVKIKTILVSRHPLGWFRGDPELDREFLEVGLCLLAHWPTAQPLYLLYWKLFPPSLSNCDKYYFGKYCKNSCISRTFLLKFWAQNSGCGLYTRPLLSEGVK